MNKQNINNLEIDLEKKYQKRDKRKRPKMKVSGAGVKELQKIIIKK
ncbi:MAG: hypothetical protein ABH830_04960 [Patescibacteria group bacterium]